MRIQVNQNINKEYYNEYFSEWLRFRSIFKKWEHKIGFASLVVALVIYINNESLVYISGGLLVFGTLMIYEFYSSKSKWLKERLNSKMMGTEVTMIFEDDKVQSIGPFTEMNGKWEFFSDVVETEKGLILIPENGISIYLQNKSFDKQADIATIVRKIKLLTNNKNSD
ncbi:hypothetical protein [Chondrinema litorale]|uniref:hypothetical protein n=1 Tax=Chondrinema litorale TaxID=2994555 RepID=UPI002543EA0F|nr:hypothetical protein [Chondrinema litorale]UZR96785.1 hypothetical protein OQ292_24095 [Chondrinema litorale]